MSTLHWWDWIIFCVCVIPTIYMTAALLFDKRFK